MGFDSISTFRRVLSGATAPDGTGQAKASARNGQLTKPPGALGRLEDVAIWVAAWQGREKPRIETPQVLIFAGNHGVAAQGVSAFPPEVTEQMVLNFEHGGAAINQLSECFGATLAVHPIKLDTPTQDFTQGPAMSEAEFVEALLVGWNAVDPEADLVITGEMGIGNTTPAAAISAALFGGGAAKWTGRGTGVSDAALSLKTEVVGLGLACHDARLDDPLAVLQCLGGRELAAMAGAIARARVEHIPVILDGFICCAAAACLDRAVAGSLDHAIAGHVSAEAAHGAVLAELGKSPLLSLEMRLGEGSGAAVALGVVKAAVACLSGMATFAEAGVAAG